MAAYFWYGAASSLPLQECVDCEGTPATTQVLPGAAMERRAPIPPSNETFFGALS